MAAVENELARAMSRLSDAISRLENVAAARQSHDGGHNDGADPAEVSALRHDAQSLRELHQAVAGKLEHAIQRLRVLVGEDGTDGGAAETQCREDGRG